MKYRKELLKKLGCLFLSGFILCTGVPIKTHAAALEPQNSAVPQSGYASTFAAEMPVQYQPTAANLLYCIDNFAEVKTQYDAISINAANYWGQPNLAASGNYEFYLYNSHYSPDPTKQYMYKVDKLNQLRRAGIPNNLYYTEQYAPLLEQPSPDGYTYHGSVIKYRFLGSGVSNRGYVAAPGIGIPLSPIDISYYARTSDEFNAGSKEKGAAYIERLFREINWTDIDMIKIGKRDIGTKILTDVYIEGHASPEYPLIKIFIKWTVEVGSIRVYIDDQNRL